MGGPKITALENCSYAADLGDPMSPREEARVLNASEEVEGHCKKTNKDLWLSQVNNKWDFFIFW